MNPVATEVFDLLAAMGIEFKYVRHEPVHTIEGCKIPAKALNAVMPKNVFLCPRNESAFYLLLIRPDGLFKTADISKQLGVSRLSFASEEKLYELMQTLPGAISPMGLLFDEEKKITLVVDSAIKDMPYLAFHPCVNDISLSMSSEMFFDKFLRIAGYKPVFVEIHDFKNDEAE